MLGLQITDYRLQKKLIVLFSVFCFLFSVVAAEETQKAEPIIVNGDVVEYITESKDFTATGNVEVDYKGTKLTCEKLILNTETKDTQAEGRARLEEENGVIEGEKMIYNFNTKAGTIIDSQFRSNPYFGKAEKTEKVSDDEFINRRGYMTTCSYDNPHYRIKSRRMNIFPGDKIQTRDSIFYIGQVPLLYIPRYSHSLRDPMVHVQLMPGSSKEWGPYLLTAWRYNLTEDVSGRIYFDLRDKWGIAEGFGVNYKTFDFGKGDFKFYYTQERVRRRHFYENFRAHLRKEGPALDERKPLGIYERYFIRLRHKWDIDESTNSVLQYYYIKDQKRAIGDSSNNFLKDYFYREYEKDETPLSYITIHRSFPYSAMDVLLQKRTNRWYSQAEYLPQMTYNLPSLQMGNTPFYFEHAGSYVNYNYKNAVPSASWNDTTYNSFNTTNKFSLPSKLAFINFNPYISNATTYWDKNGTYGSTLQLTFSTGSDLSTKFYRVFNVETNFLGLDIHDLRHIITPTIGYSYSINGTTTPRDIRISRGTSTRSSSASLGLSNKLQTKRKGQKVDLADFIVSTNYAFKPKGERGSGFRDFFFDLGLRPYSWMRIEGDATYKHSGARSNTHYGKFTNANYDIYFDFDAEHSIGFGQRYQRKGGNDVTLSFDWRLNPKWKFGFYQRRNRGHSPALKRGLREQEYRLSRDFHCWIVDFTYNVRKGQGASVWLVFRLKAFPELEFEYNQEYHTPKPGSQSNP